MRVCQLWDLGDRPSLRFVRDALRLRRTGQVSNSIDLQICACCTFSPLMAVAGRLLKQPHSAAFPLQTSFGVSDKCTHTYHRHQVPCSIYSNASPPFQHRSQIQLVVQDFLNTSDPTWAASPYVAPRPSGPTLVSDDQPPPPSPWDSQQAAPKRAEKTQVPAGEEGSAFSPTGSFLSDDEGMTIGAWW